MVVEGRSIQPKVQSAPSRAKIRTDGSINRSSFSSSLSLTLSLLFYASLAFIRGCNLERFIARDRTCCFLSLLLPLSAFILLSFFLSFL